MFPYKATSQDRKFIDTPSKIVYLDPFYRIWWVHPDNSISLYDTLAKRIYTQKLYNYGNITSIDSRDPLQLSIFYVNQGKIIYTDKFLNTLHKINLFDGVTSFQASAYCQANDGNFWIFDLIDFRLKKLNFQKQVLLTTLPIQETGAKKIQINYIVEKPPYLFVQLNKVGIAIYDIYGGFIKLIREPALKHFYYQNDYLIILSETKIVEYIVSKNIQTDVTLKVEKNSFDYLYPLKNEWLVGDKETSYIIKK
jgi:hypothetical protein